MFSNLWLWLCLFYFCEESWYKKTGINMKKRSNNLRLLWEKNCHLRATRFPNCLMSFAAQIPMNARFQLRFTPSGDEFYMRNQVCFASELNKTKFFPLCINDASFFL